MDLCIDTCTVDTIIILFIAHKNNIYDVDGYDYIESMGILTFAPQEQRKMIQVPILNDIILETKKEVFFVQFMVTSSAPGLLEGISTVTVTIIDEDCK